MASARPVVATSVGGVPDVVRDGETGYLLDSADEKGFARRLAELACDENLRVTMGAKGRDAVRDVFDKKRLIDDIGILYKRLLMKKGVQR